MTIHYNAVKRVFQMRAWLGALLLLTVTSEAQAGCLYLLRHTLEKPAPEAVAFVQRVSDTVGVSANFKINAVRFGASTPIAAATTCLGKRHIVYDKDEFLWFKEGRTDWQSLGILIHEIAHHLNGDTSGNAEEPWTRELKADYLAGFIIARLGGTEYEARAFPRVLSEEGSDSHPPRAKRLAMVSDGWRKSQSNMAWEAKQCHASEWLSKPFELEMKHCRQVKVCRAGQLEYRVACKVGKDEWDLQPWSKTDSIVALFP